MKRTLFAIVLMLVALFALGCGSEDDPTADGDTDGDASLDGDLDFVPVDGDDTVLNPAAGHWELEDTNAFKWFQAEGLTGLYVVIGNETMDFVKVSAEQRVCEGQAMRPLGGENRYAPAEDPDNCWFEMNITETGKLELFSRHVDDPGAQDRPWYFIFHAIEAVPGYDAATCDELTVCPMFSVEDSPAQR
jgi:hypothetical protein